MCGQDEKHPEVFEWAIAQEEIVYHRLQEMLDYIESAWNERGPFDGTQQRQELQRSPLRWDASCRLR